MTSYICFWVVTSNLRKSLSKGCSGGNDILISKRRRTASDNISVVESINRCYFCSFFSEPKSFFISEDSFSICYYSPFNTPAIRYNAVVTNNIIQNVIKDKMQYFLSTSSTPLGCQNALTNREAISINWIVTVYATIAFEEYLKLSEMGAGESIFLYCSN